MLRIKIKHNGKWTVLDKFYDEDKWAALDAYNGAPVPKMLISDNGVVHKQYSDNGFIYVGRGCVNTPRFYECDVDHPVRT